MQNRLTIKDIARLSGVGKSTVSRVLNNESGVSERTRERVEAVMNQHGFSPSRSARAMRGQSDKVVAIIVTRLDSLSENLAVQTMLPVFYEQGYDPIMMESQFSPQMVEEHLGMLKRQQHRRRGAVWLYRPQRADAHPVAIVAGHAGPGCPRLRIGVL